VEARGAAADGKRQDLDGAAGGAGVGALRPSDHHLPQIRPARTEQLGVQERDAPERINDYWKSVDRPNLSGLDTEVPWSAAFISWHRERRRVARPLLPRRPPHDLCRAPGAALAPAGRGLHSAPSARIRARVGDLILRLARRRRHDAGNLDRGPGHCDIVVEVRPGEVHAIGGNVRDSVSRSVFSLDANGFCRPYPAEPSSP